MIKRLIIRILIVAPFWNSICHAEILLISNVNIVDIENGVVLDSKDILIDAALIKEIREHSPVTRDTSLVIDGTGQFLIPGLWDMHVHFRTRKFVDDAIVPALIAENENLLKTYVDYGITSVFDMGSDILEQQLEWRSAIEQGDRVGPNLYLTGQKLEGPAPEFAASREIFDKDDVDRVLKLAVDSGLDGIKVMALWIDPETQQYLLDECRRLGLKTFVHALETMRASELSRDGFDAIAHLDNLLPESSRNFERLADEVNTRKLPTEPPGDWFWDLQPEFFVDLDTDILKRSLATVARNGTAIVSTYNTSRLRVHRDQIDEQVLGPLKDVGEHFARSTQRRYEPRIGREPSVPDRQLLTGNLQFLQLLPETDVLFLIGTDSGFGNHAPGMSFHNEMAALQEAGLAADYILRAATLNAAIFMEKQESEGTIAEQKKADLILLEENPLEDIRHSRLINCVIRNGVVVFRDACTGQPP